MSAAGAGAPDAAAGGRVAFVTGGSRGIGSAVVRRLAAEGHRVAFCYAHDCDGASATAAEVAAAGGTAWPVQADVADADAVGAAFDAVEGTLGPVEILVNNAGITRDGLVARLSDDHWNEVLDVNLTGAFNTIRRAVPRMMRARFGRIVNVSSVVALAGGAGQANYAAAKAGLVGLTRAVARELAPRAITCNAVSPGLVVTELTRSLGDEWMESTTGRIPLRRAGTSEECAAAAAFLCSDGAGYVTGAVVPVDGGLGMGS